jgi:hypothetical protein
MIVVRILASFVVTFLLSAWLLKHMLLEPHPEFWALPIVVAFIALIAQSIFEVVFYEEK